MVVLYAQGLSIAAVARAIGRSDKLVWLTLKRAGIRRRSSHGQPRMVVRRRTLGSAG